VKSKRFVEAIAAIGIVLFLAGVLFPVFAVSGPSGPTTQCLSNGKQLGLGMLLYASDFDERLPHSDHWLSDLDPYVKNPDLACPATPTKRYGYAMHLSLSGAELKSVEKPEERIMLFESIAVIPNAAGDEGLLPNPGRHKGRNTIAYADGHVKRVALPERLTP
jgi:prepilin-type processing-associated H-X9-DG protein